MKFLLPFFIFIGSVVHLHAQNPASGENGKWLTKYGLWLELDDSSNRRIHSVSEGGKCHMHSDTLRLSSGPSYKGKMDSLNQWHTDWDNPIPTPDVVFIVRFALDSITFFPIDSSTDVIMDKYSGHHRTSNGFVSTYYFGIKDYLPARQSHADRLVFYPIKEIYHNYAWDTLYISCYYNACWSFVGEGYDLTINKDGLVSVDRQFTKNKFGDKNIKWINKSYTFQLTQHQLDTLKYLINNSAYDIRKNDRSGSGFCSHSFDYRLKFSGDTSIISWQRCIFYEINLTPVSEYIELLLEGYAGKEIPFNGFQSPCTFLDSKI